MKNIIEAFGFEWHMVKSLLSCVTCDEPVWHSGSRRSRGRVGVSQSNRRY
jgi:hypothetical protein